MKRNLAKLTAAALAVTTVLSGTQTVALAAEATDTTTAVSTAAVSTIEYSDERIDPSNQITLTGNWLYFSNQQGSPDPVIVNNGDNTYDITMYQDTELLIEVTDTARYTEIWDGAPRYFKYGIGVVNDLEILNNIECLEGVDANEREDLTELKKLYYSAESPVSCLWLKGKVAGKVTANIGYQASDLFDVRYIRDCGVTLNITVLPAQPGSQTPVYTNHQLAMIKSTQDAEAFAAEFAGVPDELVTVWGSWY